MCLVVLVCVCVCVCVHACVYVIVFVCVHACVCVCVVPVTCFEFPSLQWHVFVCSDEEGARETIFAAEKQ